MHISVIFSIIYPIMMQNNAHTRGRTQEIQSQTPLTVTKFLSLDKCLPHKHFLQVGVVHVLYVCVCMNTCTAPFRVLFSTMLYICVCVCVHIC